MRIIVIDGMGGGIGAQLCGRLKDLTASGDELIALGTNSAATERMLKAGAQRGATGENAVKVTSPTGDFITGPIGIVIANSMMGEITAPMVKAVLSAPAERVLLPLQNEHFYITGIGRENLGKQIEEAVDYIRDKLIKLR
jgi:NAD(P)-dependent dehydrogenase (short-subunit alcohol dehydrogenase family)